MTRTPVKKEPGRYTSQREPCDPANCEHPLTEDWDISQGSSEISSVRLGENSSPGSPDSPLSEDAVAAAAPDSRVVEPGELTSIMLTKRASLDRHNRYLIS